MGKGITSLNRQFLESHFLNSSLLANSIISLMICFSFRVPYPLLFQQKPINSAAEIFCFLIGCMSQILIHINFTSYLFRYLPGSLSGNHLILLSADDEYRTFDLIQFIICIAGKTGFRQYNKTPDILWFLQNR